MSDIGLVTIHGMGTTQQDYASAFWEDLGLLLTPAEHARIVRNAVFYQDDLQHNQIAYFNRVKRKVDWGKLRKFMLFAFSDAASLESQKEGVNSPYYLAQMRILETLRAAYNDLGGAKPLIFVAHSLGGQVLSNYLWDALRETPPSNGVWAMPPAFESREQEDFCRGRTVFRLVTTGCNIPLFVGGRHRSRIVAIPKPNEAFAWHNYYDEDDVLGWPLADLSETYKALVKDHRLNAALPQGFTPLSHVQYWTDRRFHRPMLRHIRAALRLPQTFT